MVEVAVRVAAVSGGGIEFFDDAVGARVFLLVVGVEFLAGEVEGEAEGEEEGGHLMWVVGDG